MELFSFMSYKNLSCDKLFSSTQKIMIIFGILNQQEVRIFPKFSQRVYDFSNIFEHFFFRHHVDEISVNDAGEIDMLRGFLWAENIHALNYQIFKLWKSPLADIFACVTERARCFITIKYVVETACINNHFRFIPQCTCKVKPSKIFQILFCYFKLELLAFSLLLMLDQ